MSIDVIVLQHENTVTVLDVTNEEPGAIANFVERVADSANEPIRFAGLEATTLDEWGPGDIGDALTVGAEEVPVATLTIQQPDA